MTRKNVRGFRANVMPFHGRALSIRGFWECSAGLGPAPQGQQGMSMYEQERECTESSGIAHTNCPMVVNSEKENVVVFAKGLGI